MMPAHKIVATAASALLMLIHATAAEAVRNLVTSVQGKSSNYWCTWSAQSCMQGQGAKDNAPILYQVASIDKCMHACACRLLDCGRGASNLFRSTAHGG
jgi:hypothetical protein